MAKDTVKQGDPALVLLFQRLRATRDSGCRTYACSVHYNVFLGSTSCAYRMQDKHPAMYVSVMLHQHNSLYIYLSRVSVV